MAEMSIDSDVKIDEHQARQLSRSRLIEIHDIIKYQVIESKKDKYDPLKAKKRKMMLVNRMLMIEKVIGEKNKIVKKESLNKIKKDNKRKLAERKTLAEFFIDYAREMLPDDEFHAILNLAIEKAKEFTGQQGEGK